MFAYVAGNSTTTTETKSQIDSDDNSDDDDSDSADSYGRDFNGKYHVCDTGAMKIPFSSETDG